MTRKSKSPATTAKLSVAEMTLLEGLVERGALVAKPQQPNAKPRKVIAAALAPGGARVVLWLSTKTTALDEA
jgi:hypothetical protein